MSNCNTSPAPMESKKERTRREPVDRAKLPADVWQLEHAALFLGLSESCVYKMVARGAIPHAKRGGRLFFDPDKVVAWVKGGGK